MQPEEYPPQEPLSAAAQQYHEEVTKRGGGVIGAQFLYGDDPYQSILVCPAATPTGTAFAFFHGGGWTNGYKEWMAFMAPSFVDKGITFASIGYRLAPSHTFPEGFNDACAGIAWFADHAAEFGANKSRLFVGGHSAGGHYAALMAVTRPSPNIRGCLPLSGVYDFGPESGLSTRPRFLGAADSGAEVPASPILHVGQNPSPFLISHGSQDFPHLIKQAERMQQRLASAGGDVERFVLDGRNHFTASYAGGEPGGPWVPKALDWIARH